MAAPDAVLELVERFARNRAQYLNPAYNETQVRREFLDPFFTALGWDVDNTAGYAQQYKDVVHEDAIKIGLDSRAPDYSFRIGGTRKFFVEAKKPAVNLKDDLAPAYQLRRYAWSGKLPLSILTDFQELVVYDCRVKPAASDKPSAARTLYVPCEQYDERWDEIAGVFSKEAILQGSFDRYAESTKAKKGTAEVDKAFLGEIEGWRDVLARNIALRNPSLSQRELNFAVQATIDRIIFLRICEDRGIEPYGRLQGLCNGGGTYGRLRQLFFEADQRYDSGLFHFEEEKGRAGYADRLTPALAIDDKPLKDILKRLYYPDSPYEFSVLPADILGQVYEQFLGKVIRLTAGHRAVVEDKPEVKKAGGVYYTPTYIVDYIVKNTVGRLLEGLTPKQAASLRILDPACGSGSFLIGAYQYLLDWHRDWYAADAQGSAKKHAKALYQGRGGEWRLTTAEKKRILQSCIYGVDIDAQAVETTKLSLLLKVLEGETSESIDAQLSFLRERALPDLSANIKCGNSLIGPDFYDDQQLGLAGLDDEERYRINVFDWETEFPEILGKAVPEEKRGFDAVIGNPPYIRIQNLKEFAPREVEFYKRRYVSASKGNYDIYVVFVERGVSLLNARGLLGYILPHKFMNAQYGEPLRKLLATGRHVSQIVHFGHEQVFRNAATYTCLLFLSRGEPGSIEVLRVSDIAEWRATPAGPAERSRIPGFQLGSAEWCLTAGASHDLFERLAEGRPRLEEVAHVFVGLQTSADTVFILEELADLGTGVRARSGCLQEDVMLEKTYLKPCLKDHTIQPFLQPERSHVLVFPYPDGDLVPYETLAAEAPLTSAYLDRCRTVLESREKGRMKNPAWFGFVYKKNLGQFDEPKAVVQVIANRSRFAVDTESLFFTGGGNGPYYGLRPRHDDYDLPYLVALLNSRLLEFYLRQVSTPFRGGYWSYGKRFIDLLPIAPFHDNGATRGISAVSLEIAQAQSRIVGCRTPQDRESSTSRLHGLRDRLDRLVYELYGLSDHEIALVEESLPPPERNPWTSSRSAPPG